MKASQFWVNCVCLLVFGSGLILSLASCSYRFGQQKYTDPRNTRYSAPRSSEFVEERENTDQSAYDQEVQPRARARRAAPPPPPVMEDPNMQGDLASSGRTVPAVAATTSIDKRKSQRDAVRAEIMRNKMSIRGCFTQSFGYESHSGQLIYEWEFNERGRVTSIDLISTDFKMPKFERCVQNVIKKMNFPRSASESSSKVRYPFQFQ